MIPDALVSCSYLIIGSGSCIYRLINYSNTQFSKALPQFIFASIGIAAIGARSLLGLTYNLLWRHYAIDPLLIEEELLNKRDDRHLFDWTLCTFSLASIVHSLFLHHNCIVTGTVVLTSLILLETITCLKENLGEYPTFQRSINNLIVWTNTERFVSFLEAKYLTFAWILCTDIFGWTMKNNYICGANVPYCLTTSIYRPPGLYQDWSIRNSLNDYMMLAYIILITEALCQVPIN